MKPMRTTAGVGLLVLCGLIGLAAAEDLPYADWFEEELDARAAAAGVPQPPTIDRAGYAAWKKALTPRARRTVDRFCRRHADSYLRTCNGFGPLGVPMYPQLEIRDRALSEPSEAAIAAWEASLTPAQRQYLRPRCRRAERRPAEIGSEDLACQSRGTPLVISFDDEPVRFTGDAPFALVPGAPMRMAWPTAATPWLALDRNGNGAIDDGSELFGSGTMLPQGRFAADGFAALAVLDVDHDAAITAADPAFAHLLLWADHDGDRRSTLSELTPLSARITRLDLAFTRVPRCDDRGNCELERAALTWHDAAGTSHRGSLIDVHLRLLPPC
jgi:hypothetical protein